MRDKEVFCTCNFVCCHSLKPLIILTVNTLVSFLKFCINKGYGIIFKNCSSIIACFGHLCQAPAANIFAYLSVLLSVCQPLTLSFLPALPSASCSSPQCFIQHHLTFLQIYSNVPAPCSLSDIVHLSAPV